MMRALVIMMTFTACYTPDFSADGVLDACGSGCPTKSHCSKGFCLPDDSSAADIGSTPADVGPIPPDSPVTCDGMTGLRTVGTYASGWRNVVHCEDGVGPSAHWTFDGDLKERLGNPLLAATGTHQLTSSPLGQAVHSIQGGLTVASHQALDITTQTGGTITAWVRFSNSIGVNEGLISRFVSGTPDIELNNYAVLFDRAQLRMLGNGRNEAPRRDWGADTNWHFFAFVYDGTSSRYFVDGEPLGNAFTVDRSNQPESSLNTVIGSGPNEEVFNGQIDDLAIYQRPLDSASVRALYYVNSTDTNGSSEGNAALTCSTLHSDHPNLPNGIYWVDPDGNDGLDAFQVLCYMDDQGDQGGGWTVVKSWGSGNMYRNELFMSRVNSMGQSSNVQGGPNDPTYAVPYQGLKSHSTQVMVHWFFSTTNSVTHQAGHIIWNATLDQFNGAPDTANTCESAGFWAHLSESCQLETGVGNDQIVSKSPENAAVGIYAFGSLMAARVDDCKFRDNTVWQPTGNDTVSCSAYDDGRISIMVK